MLAQCKMREKVRLVDDTNEKFESDEWKWRTKGGRNREKTAEPLQSR